MNLSGRSLAWIGLATTLLALFIAGVSLFSFPTDVFAQGAPPQVQQDYANAPQTNNGPSGPIEWIASGIGDVLLGAVAGIAFVFLFIAAQLLGLAAAAFDIAVKFLVLDFGFFFGNSAGLLVGWSILRDIGNILLLFGFVSIGVQTILNINHFNVGKTLPRLVLFAILLNFSLFITEAIIDTSNGIASGIYTQAYGADTSVSAEILAQTGIVTLLNADKVIEGLIGGDQMFRTFAFLMLAVFLSVAAFALFTGAILLVTRAVVLAFLMLTSPIGFAGMAIPQLNKIADDWWSALINNALFAPVYLILIMVSLKVAQTLPLVVGGSSSPDLLSAVASTKAADIGGAIIMFLLMIGFLILSVMSAKQFSMAGASFATQMAGNLTYGVPAFFGRRTLGAASNAGARAIARSKFGRTDLGRVTAGIVGFGANKSFDVRGIKQVEKNLDSTNKIGKKGIQGIIKEQTEKKAHWDEELEAQDGTRFKELSMDMERYQRLAKEARDKGNIKRADQLDKKAKNLKGATLKTVAGKKKEREKAEKDREPLLADQKALIAESKGIVSRVEEINRQLGATRKLIDDDNKKLVEERKKATDAATAARAASLAAGMSAPEVAEAEKSARADHDVVIKQLLTQIANRQTHEAELAAELTGKKTRGTEVARELRDVTTKVDGMTKKIGHLEHEIHEQEGAYAQEVENMSRGLISMMSLGRKANRDAAMKIRKHHAQTPTDKQFADLVAGMKAAAGGGGGSGDSHAAPSKPAKGPAPKADDHH